MGTRPTGHVKEAQVLGTGVVVTVISGVVVKVAHGVVVNVTSGVVVGVVSIGMQHSCGLHWRPGHAIESGMVLMLLPTGQTNEAHVFGHGVVVNVVVTHGVVVNVARGVVVDVEGIGTQHLDRVQTCPTHLMLAAIRLRDIPKGHKKAEHVGGHGVVVDVVGIAMQHVLASFALHSGPLQNKFQGMGLDKKPLGQRIVEHTPGDGVVVGVVVIGRQQVLMEHAIPLQTMVRGLGLSIL